MTTKQAWKKMIFEKGIEEKLGIAKSTLYFFRSQVKNQEIYPSTTAMEDHLQKTGWKVVVEREWALKKINT